MNIYESLMSMAEACARETGSLLEVTLDAPSWRALLKRIDVDVDVVHPLHLAGPGSCEIVVRLKGRPQGSSWV